MFQESANQLFAVSQLYMFITTTSTVCVFACMCVCVCVCVCVIVYRKLERGCLGKTRDRVMV